MKRKYKILIVSVTIIMFGFVSYLLLKENKIKKDTNTSKVFLKNFQDNKGLVFLILGQSNAANYASKLFSTKNKIYSFYDNKVTQAKDPLRGASGTKGNLWIPFSERIINDSDFEQVMIVCIAEGGSMISDWSQGKYQKKLINTLNQLKKNNVDPDFIIWQQGEEDNLLQTSVNDYKIQLQQILSTLKSNDVNSPFFLSVTSFSPTALHPINHDLRKAQIDMVKENENIYLGPDTDKYIDIRYRYDGIHFSEKGVRKIAKEWFEIIVNYQKHLK